MHFFRANFTNPDILYSKSNQVIIIFKVCQFVRVHSNYLEEIFYKQNMIILYPFFTISISLWTHHPISFCIKFICLIFSKTSMSSIQSENWKKSIFFLKILNDSCKEMTYSVWPKYQDCVMISMLICIEQLLDVFPCPSIHFYDPNMILD